MPEMKPNAAFGIGAVIAGALTAHSDSVEATR